MDIWQQMAEFLSEYITVTLYWVRLRLKSPASRLFAQQFVQAQIKEKKKARVTGLWGLGGWGVGGGVGWGGGVVGGGGGGWGGWRDNLWIPLIKGQKRGKCCIWWRHNDRMQSISHMKILTPVIDTVRVISLDAQIDGKAVTT